MSWLTALGDSASSLFSSLPSSSTATALAIALAPIAGGMPQVVNYPGYSEIVLDPDQEVRVSEWLLTQLRSEPGPVRVDVSGVAMRVLARQYWPWMAGLVLAGGLAGLALRGKR